MAMKPRTAILHYSSPPIVGGVEAVIGAQAGAFRNAGYPVSVVSGRGDQEALPRGVEYLSVPEIDSRHPRIQALAKELEGGTIPPELESLTALLLERLERALDGIDVLIVHNVLTKHFNLALTTAISRYLARQPSVRCIAWCHDFTWTSPHSRPSVHEGYPWDLLRTRLDRVAYVTISKRRRSELAALLGCREDEIGVVYNGVDAPTLFGLTTEGRALVERLGVLDCDLSLLMPVRVTQAKNIEYAIRLTAALKEAGVRPRTVVTGPPDPHDAQSMEYFETLRELRSRHGVDEEMRFVYESGPDPAEPLLVGMDLVAQLYRICDLMFMPSHREGFGMPILEAGLMGMPIVSTSVPAADELASDNALIFERGIDPEELAGRILAFVASNPTTRFRVEVRTRLTWRAIFRRDIEPLLTSDPDAIPGTSDAFSARGRGSAPNSPGAPEGQTP